GTNFMAGTTVTVGGVGAPVGAFTATTITITTPPHAAAPVNVVVTFTDGQTGTVPYTYIDRVVTAIAPTSGPTAGGTSVTITGANFVGPVTVTLGGTPATIPTLVNPTTITATTAA